jgi:hypothetical protein
MINAEASDRRQNQYSSPVAIVALSSTKNGGGLTYGQTSHVVVAFFIAADNRCHSISVDNEISAIRKTNIIVLCCMCCIYRLAWSTMQDIG